ncbi:MAG: ABC transporter ATP-binding protein, partial [Acidobacteriota bacterium]|nr:ABC transporter ATP-binding protein [Acidobacteriota bacterium]
MKDALRLARYSRRYWHLLAFSVILMAVMGAMTAIRALLVRPVLGRALRPSMDATPEPIFSILGHSFYLESFFPKQYFHNIFVMIAISILVVFLVRGICDYFGDYLTSFVGF